MLSYCALTSYCFSGLSDDLQKRLCQVKAFEEYSEFNNPKIYRYIYMYQ